MKTCFKCKKIKDLTEFYKHPRMVDGHVNKCKSCNKKDVIENTAKNAEYYREYDRKRANLPHRVEARRLYQQTDAWKLSHKKAEKKYELSPKGKNTARRNLNKYPLKRAARLLVQVAVISKKIIKKNCEKCGSVKSQAHHDNYYEPLNVRWLCIKCHNNWHKHNIPIPF